MTGGFLSFAPRRRVLLLLRRLLSPWSATLLALVVCAWVLGLHVLQHHGLFLQIEGIENVRQARLELSERYDALMTRKSPTVLSSLEVARLRLREAVTKLVRTEASLGEPPVAANEPFLTALDEFRVRVAEWSRSPEPAAADNSMLHNAYEHVLAQANLLDHDLYASVRLHMGETDSELGRTLLVAVFLLTGVSVSVFFSEKARRVANAEALEAGQRLRQAVEAARVGLWDWDLCSGKVHYSTEWKHQIGYEDDEISDELAEWQCRVHPDDLEGALARTSAYIAHPWPDYRNEFRLRHRDGSYRWIVAQASLIYDDEAKPIRMMGSHLDMTEQRRMEEAIRDERDRFAAVACASPGVLHSWRLRPDGTSCFAYAAPGIKDLYGFTPEEVVESDALLVKVVHPEDREAIWRSVREACESMKPWCYQYRVLHPERGEVWIEGRSAPVREADGSIIWHGVLTDITDRKVGEEALKDSLQEKTVLLREVHHRVKNNLQIVSSLVRLQAVRSTDEPVRQALEEMGARVGSIALLHEVLYGSENLARVDFAEYVGELCKQLQRSYGTSRVRVMEVNRAGNLNLSLEQCVPCGLILNELVSNAFKHAFPEEASGTVWAELEREGNLLRLRVRDDGVGLGPDFSVVSPRTLGLQLVSNLVGQLGGRWTAERSNGAGAVFSVTFSVAADSAEGA